MSTIESSHNNHKKYALFIGRWQPFHKGHKYLIDQALAKKENVCIGIRDTKLSQQDPYTVEQRAEMIRSVYSDKIKIIVTPDISSINIGRNVGYDVNIIDIPNEIKKISGTKIRNGKQDKVPSEVKVCIETLKTTIWLTGLPCSGKTTLAKKLKELLENKGYCVVHLDGDDLRKELNADLGFSEKDREENLRRVAHLAKIFNKNGNLVIASFVSPTEKMRAMIRQIVGNLKLIHIKCSLKECKKRDSKGMYAKAIRNEIKDFTGINAPFEKPLNADIIVDTEKFEIEECVSKILEGLGIRYSNKKTPKKNK